MKRCLNPYEPPDSPGVFFGCGHCLACKIQRRSLWAIRMMHQYTVSQRACFVTLTYDDRHLMRSPSLITHAGTLMKHHLQTFFKRMRKRYKDVFKDLKYYACGEYGDLTLRPHYHAIIFGLGPEVLGPDLEVLWHHGTRNDCSEVTEGRMNYVAGYIDKKFFGDLGFRAYRDVEPPFQLSSNGIGVDFVLRNYEQMLYDGCIKIRKSKIPMPKVYLDALRKYHPDAVAGVEIRQGEAAKMFGLEYLLENFPEFGGRSYEELDMIEKGIVRNWLADRNRRFHNDLKARFENRPKSGV